MSTIPTYDICQYTLYLKEQLGTNQVFTPWQIKKVSDKVLDLIEKDLSSNGMMHSVIIEGKDFQYKANTQPIIISLNELLGVNKDMSIYYCVYLVDRGVREYYSTLEQHTCFENDGTTPQDMLLTLFWDGKRFYNFLGADIKLHNKLFIKRAKRSWRRKDFNDMAQELIANKDQRLKIIGYLFHLLNNREQDGYVNGLFGHLSSNYKGRYVTYNEALKHSTIPNVRWCCGRLSCVDKGFLDKALKNYGYNANTFDKWVKKQIKRLEWKTPRAYEVYLIHSGIIEEQ